MPASLPFVTLGVRGSRGRLDRTAVRGLAVALVAITAACGDERPRSDSMAHGDPLASDSTLARDLTLAGPADRAAAFSDTVQVASRGTVERPAPAAPAASVPAREPARQGPATPSRVGRSGDEAPAARPGRQPAPSEAVVAAAPRTQSADGVEAGGEAPTPVPAEPGAGPAPAPDRGVIAAGSTLDFTTSARVCTSSNAPGDKIVATLDDAARGSSGFVLSAGTKAVLEVAAVERDDAARPSTIHFRLRNLDDGNRAYRARGDVATLDTLQRARSTKRPAAVGRTVAGGAVLGAAAGQVLGRNTKSTVIGAAAGTAIGALSVARSVQRSEACLPAGAKVQVRLAEAVTAE